MTTTCGATTIWAGVPPHGVRLTCELVAGHRGDHAGSVEHLPAPEATA